MDRKGERRGSESLSSPVNKTKLYNYVHNILAKGNHHEHACTREGVRDACVLIGGSRRTGKNRKFSVHSDVVIIIINKKGVLSFSIPLLILAAGRCKWLVCRCPSESQSGDRTESWQRRKEESNITWTSDITAAPFET